MSDPTAEHIQTLEVKIAFLEDFVDALNGTVYQQQLKIDMLEQICKHLLEKINVFDERISSIQPIDEKPPHY